jgi:hypothetical protein
MAWNKVAGDTVALLSAEAGRHPTIGAPGPHRGAVHTKRRIHVRWAARTFRSTAPASSSSTTRSSAHLHRRAWVTVVIRPRVSWPTGPGPPTASSRPPRLIPRSRVNSSADSPSTSISRSTVRRLRVTAHADSAIRDGVPETATFANGSLTKMIKARLHLQQSGPD